MIKNIKFYVFILFTLIIWYFWFVKSSYVLADASSYQLIWLDSSPSAVNSSYNVTFLKWGGLLSNFLWQSKSVLALDTSALFWRTPDWLPYYYWHGRTDIQWYFPNYYVCNSLTSWWNYQAPENCTVNSLDESNIYLLKSFFQSVNAWDVVYYLYTDNWGVGWWWYGFEVCFNSSVLWNSICFKTMSNYNRPCVDEGWGCLVNSRWYTNLTFANLPYSEIWYAPWQAWYWWGWNIEWSSNTSENVNMTWNLLFNACSNWYVINQIRNVYWSDIDVVCYAWSTNTWEVYSDIDPWSWIPKLWFNFKEIYNLTSDWMSWSNWFRGYEDEMLRWKQGRVWTNPFVGRPVALYSYFSLLFDYWFLGWWSSVDWPTWMWPYFILNYCKLSYTDLNAPYEWTYFKTYCSDLNNSSNNWWSYNTWDIWSVDWDWEVLPPWFDDWGWWNDDWTVTSSWTVVSVDWSWTLSWNTNQNFDWTNFINSFYQKLQANFQKPTNNLVWIIPNYILVFMFALILFRFLSH